MRTYGYLWVTVALIFGVFAILREADRMPTGTHKKSADWDRQPLNTDTAWKIVMRKEAVKS